LSGTFIALVLAAQFYSGMDDFQRLSFSLPLADGAGTAIGLAGRMEYLRPNYIVATGGVDVRYGSQRIQARRIEMDLTDETVLAEGDVILDEGPRRIAGQRMEFDLGSQTGTVYDAKASFGDDLYFYGAEMSKVGPDVYEVVDGILTACEKENPAWSFRLARARVVMEGFARIYNTTIRVKKLPLLYAPFMLVPAKTERAAGFLMPNLGYSQRYGTVIGAAWFQPFGDSYDATISGETYSEGINAGGLEFRYAPVLGTSGEFDSYVVSAGSIRAAIFPSGSAPSRTSPTSRTSTSSATSPGTSTRSRCATSSRRGTCRDLGANSRPPCWSRTRSSSSRPEWFARGVSCPSSSTVCARRRSAACRSTSRREPAFTPSRSRPPARTRPRRSPSSART
jgi:hypothetical protein